MKPIPTKLTTLKSTRPMTPARPFTKTHLQKINDKLDALGQYHQELVEDLPPYDEFVAERLTRRGIEKTIELIADAVLDITMIIISAKGLEKPVDSAESIRVLSKHKFLSPGLAAKLEDLIRFRNLLVHRYAHVEEEKEYANIEENHEDIVDFIKEMEVLLRQEKQEQKSQQKLSK